MVPVGGGGLIAGIALAVKSLHPHVQGNWREQIHDTSCLRHLTVAKKTNLIFSLISDWCRVGTMR